ncbi:MAG: GntR family transcriptional regulator [Erysipelotrichaceae bacterium]|jgi:DNA-binding GntR family transcriptional regulator|nr:GntR family transcriptional regulator [Erysipelotrichaceae bacterium]
MKLDHEIGGRPLWSQIFEILKNRIDEGEYPAGSLMPSEKEISDEFEVSRITVRQAMEKLAREELIERRRGKGTTVRRKPEKMGTSFVSSFHGEEKNNRKDRRVLECGYAGAPVEAAYFFGIPVGQPVLKLVRMSYLDSRPVTYYETYISLDAKVTDQDDYSGSLYQLLKTRNNEIDHIKEQISAHISTKQEKQLFELQKNTAVISRIRMGTHGGIPVEYTESKYVADGYELTIEQGI